MNLSAKSLSSVIFLVCSATILTALAFEHIGGLKPCPLCLQQRYAYYFVIPVSLICFLISEDERKWIFFKYAMMACGLAMLANTALGSYHAGVEWGLWPGPNTCAATPVGELKPDLSGPPPVSCTEAAWRFMGISMAGYNAMISLFVFTLSTFAHCSPTSCKI